jgi:hypothetical protein
MATTTSRIPGKRLTPQSSAWWKAAVRRYRFLIAGVLVAAVAVVLAVALWPSPPARVLPPARARVYLAFDACLLTGAQGIADPAAAPVWAGMQDASNATRAKVSYLAAAGPDTVGTALPYLAGLLQRHCDVILAVGQAEVAAANQQAPSNSGVHFIEVTGAGSAKGANVTVVENGSAAEVRTTVANLVRGLVH